MQSVINLPEQLVGWQLRCKVPQLLQMRQEILSVQGMARGEDSKSLR